MMGLTESTIELIKKMSGSGDEYALPVIPYGTANTLINSNFAAGMDIMNASIGGGLMDSLSVENDLISRFVDYETQDDSPLISSALDIYADDMSQYDSMSGRTMWVESDDEDIRRELDDLLNKTLKIEDRIWSECRTLCKYGNNYLESVVKNGAGVVAANMIAPPTVRRIEYGPTPESKGFIYDPTGIFRISTNEFIEKLSQRSQDTPDPFGATRWNPSNTTMVFEGWEIAHFRLNGKKPNSVYGFGVGDAARSLYKRLMLLEDSIIIHRLTRAPSRYAFYVDVSNVPPDQTSGYLNKIKQALKKQKFVNPQTGRMDMKFDISSTMDDFFLPTRDGKESTRVETLNGPVYDHIEDVKYFEDKLFAALKVPRAFLTYEESTAKTNLSAEDSRFARTIMRYQREMMNGYRKICNVHLAAKGIHPDSSEFRLKMTIPSAIFELAQLEIKNAELELADKFGAYAPREWIMKTILGFSDEQINDMELMRMREEEAGSAGESGTRPSGGSSGAIEQALSKRGSPRAPERAGGDEPLASVAAGESRGKIGSDQYMTRGIKKNFQDLNEKIEELKLRDKKFEKKWDRITGLLGDIQSNIGRSK